MAEYSLPSVLFACKTKRTRNIMQWKRSMVDRRCPRLAGAAKGQGTIVIFSVASLALYSGFATARRKRQLSLVNEWVTSVQDLYHWERACVHHVQGLVGALPPGGSGRLAPGDRGV